MGVPHAGEAKPAWSSAAFVEARIPGEDLWQADDLMEISSRNQPIVGMLYDILYN